MMPPVHTPQTFTLFGFSTIASVVFFVECRKALAIRKKALKRFTQVMSEDNHSQFNIARAKARRQFRASKKETGANMY